MIKKRYHPGEAAALEVDSAVRQVLLAAPACHAIASATAATGSQTGKRQQTQRGRGRLGNSNTGVNGNHESSTTIHIGLICFYRRCATIPSENTTNHTIVFGGSIIVSCSIGNLCHCSRECVCHTFLNSCTKRLEALVIKSRISIYPSCIRGGINRFTTPNRQCQAVITTANSNGIITEIVIYCIASHVSENAAGVVNGKAAIQGKLECVATDVVVIPRRIGNRGKLSVNRGSPSGDASQSHKSDNRLFHFCCIFYMFVVFQRAAQGYPVLRATER